MGCRTTDGPPSIAQFQVHLFPFQLRVIMDLPKKRKIKTWLTLGPLNLLSQKQNNKIKNRSGYEDMNYLKGTPLG